MNEPACLCAVKERGPLARGMLGRRRRPIRSRGSGGRGPEPGLCRLAWPGLAQHGPARPGSMQELARLRRVNRDLLGRLRAQQEEIRRRLPRGPAGPAPRGGKENRGLVTEGTSDPETLVSVAPSAARAALCSPTKPAVRGREGRGASRPRTSIQRAAASEGGSLRAERSCTPAAAGTRCARGASRAAGDSRSPEGESLLPGHGESSERFVTLRSPQEKGRVGTKLEPVLSQTQAEENGEHPVLVREPRRPKSILLMPQCREAKEAGHVTFQDNLEEYTIPEGSWSVRPLLGYDWIAGLLETDSSVSEKSEQYFAELQEFRLVNKEACVYEQCLEPEALDYLAPEQDVDLVPTSHQCIYCFRLNKRLFPVPVDSASACPICKTPRAQRPPETLEEPAYIRVSIPRATLLPAHKYKIHRRKSFEAADNLALPSHCLVGWENVIPFGSPTMSSLDLRTSLEEKPTDPFPSELGIQSVRRN
ncbi:migration and invasion-inhibitory protein [Alligator mississippiensis]|uniref:migration and invasion-inhibitory protein n=1 Tax=Alligator mississippiensis TaxID=8496 RepID=UPI0028772698|nr:migration and invasion-inhibitory protein [Alligator mississippiensis]